MSCISILLYIDVVKLISLIFGFLTVQIQSVWRKYCAKSEVYVVVHLMIMVYLEPFEMARQVLHAIPSCFSCNEFWAQMAEQFSFDL